VNIFKNTVILLSVISSVSCVSRIKEKGNLDTNELNVRYDGALKNIMHKGDLTAKANLKDLEDFEHLYALGALENLKGEIQIFDSEPYNTIVVDSSLYFDNSYNKKATLLVYATVSKWQSINIPDSVLNYKQLEHFVAQSARAKQIKIDQPFPFLIEGKPTSVDWHVINWKAGDTVHSHDKHISSGLNGILKNKEVEMLGFYSNAHHAIFTHHTTNMHIHVKTVDITIAGHVDGLTLGQGMILKLPKTSATR